MKIDPEKIFLAIIFGTLLLVGVGILFDHKISHPFPWAHLASDTFQHQVRTESIKLMGNYRIEAPYIVAGYTDNPGFYPPALYHIGIIFSNVAGLETYDGAYLLVFILSSLSALLMYFIIRRWNKYVAILSLPVSILIFHSAPYIGFTWGHWPAITAQVFLIALFWSIANINLKNSYLFIGISLAGIVMTHTSEAIFGAIFLVFYVLLKFLKKEFTLKQFKTLFIGGLISLIVSFYYLVIFKFTWARMQPFSFTVTRDFGGSPFFQLQTFGLLSIFLALGIILSIIFWKKIKDNIPFLIGISMLLIGYLNYAGFGFRAFQARFFWPIYLSAFIGFGIYYLPKFFGKKWNKVFAIGTALLLLLSLSIGQSSNIWPRPAKFTTPGLMNAMHWEMIQWFQQNGRITDKVLFLYGDIYGQNAVLRNTLIPPVMVKFDDYFQALQNRTIKREYILQILGDHHGVFYAYRPSFFDFEYRAEEFGWDYYYETKRDICNFDYYVVDKVSRQPVLAQYNVLIANEFFKTGSFSEVFANQAVSVLRNADPGNDCIPKEGITI